MSRFDLLEKEACNLAQADEKEPVYWLENVGATQAQKETPIPVSKSHWGRLLCLNKGSVTTSWHYCKNSFFLLKKYALHTISPCRHKNRFNFDSIMDAFLDPPFSAPSTVKPFKHYSIGNISVKLFLLKP